jgi:hypothetical protein
LTACTFNVVFPFAAAIDAAATKLPGDGAILRFLG